MILIEGQIDKQMEEGKEREKMRGQRKNSKLKKEKGSGTVAHACNPSTLEGQDRQMT